MFSSPDVSRSSARETIRLNFRTNLTSRTTQRVETPAGEVARTVHVGPYDRLGDAHAAIHAWCAAHGRTIGPASWETYGHWTDDPAQLKTTISYLLL